MKTVYYEDEDFTLQFNEDKGAILIHCEVFNWKLSSLKRGYRVFAEMVEDFSSKGVTHFYSVTPNPRFCELLGGKKLEGFSENGYEVYIWELKSLQGQH